MTEKRVGFFREKMENGDPNAKIHLLMLKNQQRKGELCPECIDQVEALEVKAS